MTDLTVLQKFKHTRLKISQGSVTLLSKVVSYQAARVRQTYIQLKKKSTSKNK